MSGAHGRSEIAYLMVALTVLLGVYGQLVLKWRVGRLGAFPAETGERVRFVAGFLRDPWVLSSLAGAVLAAACWVVALSHLDLSRAYPFVSASFVLVLVASAIFFGDTVTTAKVAGALLIVAGLIIGSRG